jgi:hypothetical protein
MDSSSRADLVRSAAQRTTKRTQHTRTASAPATRTLEGMKVILSSFRSQEEAVCILKVANCDSQVKCPRVGAHFTQFLRDQPSVAHKQGEHNLAGSEDSCFDADYPCSRRHRDAFYKPWYPRIVSERRKCLLHGHGSDRIDEAGVRVLCREPTLQPFAERPERAPPKDDEIEVSCIELARTAQLGEPSCLDTQLDKPFNHTLVDLGRPADNEDAPASGIDAKRDHVVSSSRAVAAARFITRLGAVVSQAHLFVASGELRAIPAAR